MTNIPYLRSGKSTQQDNHTVEPEGFSTLGYIGLGAVLSAMILVAFAGNILVFIAITQSSRLKCVKSNLVIASLALADMLVAIVMIFALVNELRMRWDFGPSFCLFWICSDITLCTASINHLCLVCVERYVYITHPLHYETMVTKGRLISIIVLVWMGSAFIAFVPLYSGWHKPPSDRQMTTPDPTLCILDISFTYAVVSSSISFYIPCVIMFCLYLHIYLVASSHFARMKKQVSPLDYTAVRGSSFHFNIKATVTVGMVFGAFFVCWMPFFVINPMAARCGDCVRVVLFQVFTWLGWGNSSVNPFIYALRNKEIQNYYLRTVFKIPVPRTVASYTTEITAGRNNLSAVIKDEHIRSPPQDTESKLQPPKDSKDPEREKGPSVSTTLTSKSGSQTSLNKCEPLHPTPPQETDSKLQSTEVVKDPQLVKPSVSFNVMSKSRSPTELNKCKPLHPLPPQETDPKSLSPHSAQDPSPVEKPSDSKALSSHSVRDSMPVEKPADVSTTTSKSRKKTD